MSWKLFLTHLGNESDLFFFKKYSEHLAQNIIFCLLKITYYIYNQLLKGPQKPSVAQKDLQNAKHAMVLRKKGPLYIHNQLDIF